MPARELYLWIAFDRENPISDRRGDIQAAQIASAIFQAQGAKVSLSDTLIEWSPKEEEDADEAAIEAFFLSMT